MSMGRVQDVQGVLSKPRVLSWELMSHNSSSICVLPSLPPSSLPTDCGAVSRNKWPAGDFGVGKPPPWLGSKIETGNVPGKSHDRKKWMAFQHQGCVWLLSLRDIRGHDAICERCEASDLKENSKTRSGWEGRWSPWTLLVRSLLHQDGRWPRWQTEGNWLRSD